MSRVIYCFRFNELTIIVEIELNVNLILTMIFRPFHQHVQFVFVKRLQS